MKLTDDNVQIALDTEYSFDLENEAIIIQGDAKKLKQQIISNQEKAEKWDNMNKSIYESKDDKTKVSLGGLLDKLQQENKRLKELLAPKEKTTNG